MQGAACVAFSSACAWHPHASSAGDAANNAVDAAVMADAAAVVAVDAAVVAHAAADLACAATDALDAGPYQCDTSPFPVVGVFICTAQVGDSCTGDCPCGYDGPPIARCVLNSNLQSTWMYESKCTPAGEAG